MPFVGVFTVCIMVIARTPLSWLPYLLTGLLEPSWRHLLAIIGIACEQPWRKNQFGNMGGNKIVFGDEPVSS